MTKAHLSLGMQHGHSPENPEDTELNVSLSESRDALARLFNTSLTTTEEELIRLVATSRIIAIGSEPVGENENLDYHYLHLAIRNSLASLKETGLTHIAVPCNPAYEIILNRLSPYSRELFNGLEDRMQVSEEILDTIRFARELDLGVLCLPPALAGLLNDLNDRAQMIAGRCTSILETDPSTKLLMLVTNGDLVSVPQTFGIYGTFESAASRLAPSYANQLKTVRYIDPRLPNAGFIEQARLLPSSPGPGVFMVANAYPVTGSRQHDLADLHPDYCIFHLPDGIRSALPI